MMIYNREHIIDLYNNGYSTKKIAEQLGTYNTTIRRILLSKGVKLRSYSEAQTSKPNMFECYSDEAYYWIGMLAADGYIGDKVNTIYLSLQERDLHHLQKYAEFVNDKVRSYYNSKYSIYEYRVKFRHETINKWFKSIGITARKSATLKLNIPLNWHILRGVIDGDGYIRKDKGTVEIATQSLDFKNQIQDFLFTNGIHNTYHTKDNLYIIGIYSKKHLCSLYKKLYSDTNLFLERKRNRFYSHSTNES